MPLGPDALRTHVELLGFLAEQMFSSRERMRRFEILRQFSFSVASMKVFFYLVRIVLC